MIIRSSVLALLLPLACSGYERGGLDFMDDVTVLFAITDELFDFLFEDEGNRCFDGFDVDSLMDNPFQAVDNRCTTIESVTFNDALDEFQACSGFDLNELIETFGSVFLGILLNCGAYEIGVAKSFDGMKNIDRMKQQDSLFPRVNPECVDALVGDNIPLQNPYCPWKSSQRVK